jgi:hypothetical protein
MAMTEFERMQEFSKGALIAELEKIKAEMERNVFTIGGYEFIDIIDDHISKLRKESEDKE